MKNPSLSTVFGIHRFSEVRVAVVWLKRQCLCVDSDLNIMLLQSLIGNDPRVYFPTQPHYHTRHWLKEYVVPLLATYEKSTTIKKVLAYYRPFDVDIEAFDVVFAAYIPY